MSEIGPYFLDANIIMYALGQEHPLKEPCRTLIDQIGDGRFAVVFQSPPGKIISTDKHFDAINKDWPGRASQAEPPAYLYYIPNHHWLIRDTSPEKKRFTSSH